MRWQIIFKCRALVGLVTAICDNLAALAVHVKTVPYTRRKHIVLGSKWDDRRVGRLATANMRRWAVARRYEALEAGNEKYDRVLSVFQRIAPLINCKDGAPWLILAAKMLLPRWHWLSFAIAEG